MGHFPKPLREIITCESKENQNKLNLQKRIQQCQLCPLAAKSNALVANVIEQRKYFILAEFPDTIEDQTNEVFSIKSPFQILLKSFF